MTHKKFSITKFIYSLGFKSTLRSLRFDFYKFKARVSLPIRSYFQAKLLKQANYLHLGCGKRMIAGFLNIDLHNSDFDLDLSDGRLPFTSCSIDLVVSQHFIEHLSLEQELQPLLHEIYRVMTVDGYLYLSCPDLAKICNSYSDDFAKKLLEDRLTRFPNEKSLWASNIYPSQHFINLLFHQSGAHKNLFDFPILASALSHAGFRNVRNISESIFLDSLPVNFPRRNDDLQSLYISAQK